MRIRSRLGTARTVLLFLWQIIWPFLLYQVMVELLYFLTGSFAGEMGTLFFSAAVTSAVLFYFYGNRKERYRNHAGRSFKVRMGMPESIFMILVFAASSTLFFNILIELSGVAEYSNSYQETEEILFGASLWLQFLVMGLAAPLVEELIFRGMCYERLRNVMGIAPAAVLSAVFFGLVHGNLVQGVYGFAFGVIAALIYEHFDGLIYSILFHIGANVVSIFVTLLSSIFPTFFSLLLVKLAVMAISGGLLAVSFRVLYSRKRRMTK